MSAAGPPHWTAPTLEGVRHGFFGRRGGVSGGVYASLNAGVGSNDDAQAVQENRRRIAAVFDARHLVGVHQVHSPTAVFVSAAFDGARPHADALVTKTPGLPISVLAADCTPVLLADREAGVIGAAHAGWKGALGGVLESIVTLMVVHGARRDRIQAAIGPCIHPASYEVGPEFEDRFCAAEPSFARFFTPGEGDRRFFDLPGLCAARLAAAAVTAVETLPLDTYAQPDALFSNRRALHEKAGDYGRNCAAIAL